jgi:hypothetical protein
VSSPEPKASAGRRFLWWLLGAFGAVVLSVVSGTVGAWLKPLDRVDVLNGAHAVTGWLGGEARMERWAALLFGFLALLGAGLVVRPIIDSLGRRRVARVRPPPHAALTEVLVDGVLWLVKWHEGAGARVRFATPLCTECRNELVDIRRDFGPNVGVLGVLVCESCTESRSGRFQDVRDYYATAERRIEREGRERDAGR